jgi:RNA polymerase sigma-70 factor (ECF subfamily)
LENVAIEPRLSQMSTQWAMVFQAHSGPPDEASKAASQLMCRYAGAVHRYLLKALKNPDAASELDQEFAVRFLKGDFRHCDPKRGRFRDYVKRAVQNLINDYYRRKRPSVALDSRFAEPAVEDSGLAQFDRQFLESWRNDLLDRAWNLLSEFERSSHQPYFTVLRSRVEYPDLQSKELAMHLSAILGRPVTSGAFRQVLQRSRQKYVDFLIQEVMGSLDHPTRDNLEEELSDLKLLDQCRPFLRRRPGAA